eukprot:scaffold32117_cov35-Tisochrysis_lutea.AAC.3
MALGVPAVTCVLTLAFLISPWRPARSALAFTIASEALCTCASVALRRLEQLISSWSPCPERWIDEGSAHAQWQSLPSGVGVRGGGHEAPPPCKTIATSCCSVDLRWTFDRSIRLMPHNPQLTERHLRAWRVGHMPPMQCQYPAPQAPGPLRDPNTKGEDKYARD